MRIKDSKLSYTRRLRHDLLRCVAASTEYSDQGVLRHGPFMLSRVRLSGQQVVLVTFSSPLDSWLDDEEMARLIGLSRRQAQVARRMAQGRTNLQIAEELAISRHTVRSHGEAAFRRLGVTNRRHLAGLFTRIVLDHLAGHARDGGYALATSLFDISIEAQPGGTRLSGACR